MSIISFIASLTMLRVIFSICLLCSVAKAKYVGENKNALDFEESNAMLKMMDAMEVLMTGDDNFNQTFYLKLRGCMDKFDPRLTKAQDMAWQGIIDYWKMRDSVADSWGSFPTRYLEHNITVTTVDGMTIYEPCDYASNVAYYHDVNEFCDKMASSKKFSIPDHYVKRLGSSFSFLAMGSSFMHGSNTLLGRTQDRRSIRAVSYLLHQSSLSALISPSNILTDLSENKRPHTSIEIVEKLMNMYLTESVSDWYQTTVDMDTPDYMLSFAGIFSTALTIGFDAETVDYIIPMLTEAFKMPVDMKHFLIHKYIPEIRKATKNKHFDYGTRVKFLGDTFGCVTKLIYAFLWQERVLTKDSVFLDPLVNLIGWELLPNINKIANQLSSFHHFEKDFQAARNIYPGSNWCNERIPHAKWHLESSIGLVDLAYLCDEMYTLLSD